MPCPAIRWMLLATLLAGVTARSARAEFPTPKNTEKSTTQPMPPEEVCRQSKLPPGFQLGVFAAEPDVQNPIAITTDERGRVWVAENYTYAGAGAGWFDTTLRDRVIVLADTDGDGRHDKRTVFWDEGRKLTSVEVGFGGVWVLCAPQLLFIPDADRDDVPDGPPVVVLDGFGEGAVGHNIVNGLKWGPDGWLYGRHGIQETSQIGTPGASESQRAKINTGIWRYHPTRRKVEAVMHGMTNAWGFDYDEHGEMFAINTVIGHLWHVVPGARTRRMYGVDMNPHAYQLIEQTADHFHWDTGEQWHTVQKGVSDKTSAAGGGHAHCGLMIYQGDNWPAERRGLVYTLNMHGRRINCDRLERQGAGFTAKHEPDFCSFADPWFRGMDLITGPDGGVLIADWSDTGECHDHDGVHRTSGRIYKLTYGQAKKLAPFDLAKASDEELIKLQSHPNDWYVRQSLRLLQERQATAEQAIVAGNPSAEVTAGVKRRKELISGLRNNTSDGKLWLHGLWAANLTGNLDLRGLGALLVLGPLGPTTDEAANAAIRAWCVRLLADRLPQLDPDQTAAVADEFARLVQKERDGLVDLYLASALEQLPWQRRWPIAAGLAAEGQFAQDRMLPQLLWYGIEPAVARDPQRALELAASTKIPLLRENIARRLTLEIERDPATVEKLIELAVGNDPAKAQSIVEGMAAALHGWRKAPAPANWLPAASRLLKTDAEKVRKAVDELAIVFGDGRAIDQLRAIVVNGNAEPESRRQALRALAAGKPADFAPVLQNLLGDRAVVVDALRGLAAYDDPKTPENIVSRLGGFSPEARSEAINTLASRPAYAAALLDAIAAKKLAPGEVSAYHARQIRAFDRPELNSRLTELWGDVRVSAAEKQALIDRYKAALSSDTLAKADTSAGRALFNKTCANCHVLYGAGRKVGPDLTGSNRKNLDYLLENIVDPSASVGADFRVLLVTLADGRVISGVVSQQNERTITLETPQEPLTLDRREIDESKQSSNSLMPDGQLQNLSADEIRDLIGYLMSTDQVPLPR